MWHRFLGLDGRQGAQQEAQVSAVDLNRQKRRRQGSHERREDVKKGDGGELVSRRGKGWVSSKRERAIRKAMQQVLSQDNVSFRSAEQELALHAVINRQTPLVIVLPTSGGKSLLFSVPACLDDAGVTVVVVPYQALIKDLVSRMQKRSINCIE
jgi:superfamily II DNA helicase RecQ